MEMKLLSYTLSRLEIYFITCIYRTSVAFYVRECAWQSDSYACMRCVRIRRVRVGLRACCVWQKWTKEVRDAEAEMCKRDNFVGKKCAPCVGKTRDSSKSSERNRQATLTCLSFAPPPPILLRSSRRTAACFGGGENWFCWHRYEILILFVGQ